MTIEAIKLALAEVVSGDLRHLEALAGVPQSDIALASDQLGSLRLSKSNLRRVIMSLRDAKAKTSSVQRWASFMRRGYFEGGTGPVQPIEIAYDVDSEEVIAHIVSRLDELGDQVDGEIDDTELASMLQLLASG